MEWEMPVSPYSLEEVNKQRLFTNPKAMHPLSASVLPSLLMVLDFVLSQAWILCDTRKTSHLLLSSFTVSFLLTYKQWGIVIKWWEVTMTRRSAANPGMPLFILLIPDQPEQHDECLQVRPGDYGNVKVSGNPFAHQLQL